MTTMIQHLKKVLTVALLSAVITTGGNLFAQSISPNNPNNGNALWQTDGKDTVMTNRFVKVNNSMRVLGPLHVGKNSLTLLGLGSTTSDDITSTNGVILFGGAPTFSNIRVGIGTTTPASGNALDVTGAIAVNGKRALSNFGFQNIFVGDGTGFSNTTGSQNSYLGISTGYYNASGSWNTFIGSAVGLFIDSSDYNTFIGSASGYFASRGNYNCFMGWHSGNFNMGSFNTFLGSYAGYSNTEGFNNSFIGTYAGGSNTKGGFNSFFGYRAGLTNDTGNYNTYLGSWADGSATLTNATAIGSNAMVTTSNSMVLGSIDGVNNATDTVKVGIGTTAPQRRLEVVDGTTGNSGLRLTSLPGATPGVSNGNVLSINPANGDVILVNDSIGSGVDADADSSNELNTSLTLTGTNLELTDVGGTLTVDLSPLTEPAPPNNSVQFNKGGIFGGNADLTWDDINNRLGIGTTTPKGELEIFSTTGSFFTNTLPIVKNGLIGAAGAGAGWRMLAGGTGAKQWAIHSSGPANFQGTGKLVFHCTTDSTDAITLTSTGPSAGEGRVGIGTFSPNNLLEINTSDPLPTTTLGGRSGLRFQDLTSASTPKTSNGKVLTVNTDGNVILVNDSVGTGTGGICDTAVSNYLPKFTSATTLCNSQFIDDGTNTGITSSLIGNKFYVPLTASSSTNTAGFFNVMGTGTNNFGYRALSATCFVTAPTTACIGIEADATGGNANKGVQGGAIGNITSSKNFGGFFSAFNGTESYGGSFDVGGGITKNFGIKSHVSGAAFSGVTGDYAGVFEGDVFATSIFNGTSYVTFSDGQLKTDTTSFTNGLNVIRNIHPISYKFNGKAGLDTTRIYTGVIAEDLAQIAPYAVETFFSKLDSADALPTALLAVRNDAIMYTAINAIKQLDSTVSTLTGGGSSGWSGAGTGEIYVTSATDNVTIGAINSGNSKFYVTNNTKETTGNFESYGTGGTGTLTGLRGYAAGPGRSIAILGELAKGTDGFAGYFKGNVLSEGDIAANRFSTISDSRYKTNVQSITYALDKVEQLQGIRYEWDTVTYPDKNFKPGTYLGFIGQDVETVIPEVVSINDSGFYSLDYDRIVPLHNEAIKELNHKIDSLQNSITDKDSVISLFESRLSYLENCLSNHPGFCGSAKMGGNSIPNTQSAETANVIQVNLSSENLVILFQNEPNPFNGQTTIRYFISENINDAEMIFYDEFGRELQKVAITEKGYGQIDASTTNLAAGIYTYSILTEGKVADTKKMLRSR